jgi:hypothetical protein
MRRARKCAHVAAQDEGHGEDGVDRQLRRLGLSGDAFTPVSNMSTVGIMEMAGSGPERKDAAVLSKVLDYALQLPRRRTHIHVIAPPYIAASRTE